MFLIAFFCVVTGLGALFYHFKKGHNVATSLQRGAVIAFVLTMLLLVGLVVAEHMEYI